jgi:hypothetical protein
MTDAEEAAQNNRAKREAIQREAATLRPLRPTDLIDRRDELLDAWEAHRRTYRHEWEEADAKAEANAYWQETCRIFHSLGLVLNEITMRPPSAAARLSAEVPGLIAKAEAALARFWRRFTEPASLLSEAIDEDGGDFVYEKERVQAAFDPLKLCLLRLGWSELEWNVFLEAHFAGVKEHDDSLMFSVIPPQCLPGAAA